MESFLGIGKPDTDPVSFACPSKADGSLADQVAIGFQAQSSCEGLTRFKVRLTHFHHVPQEVTRLSDTKAKAF